MSTEKKGVRLEHISKIYQDPKTHKDFYAVKDVSLDIDARQLCDAAGSQRLRQDHDPADDRGL